ncbi:putative aquaporin 1 [Ceratobasidium sp. AG-I]|nr:putative aquaporin 1 [Ceratobasidium sp. AG-I]
MQTNSKSLFGDIKGDVHAATLEFIGTALWLLLSLGGVQSAAFSASAHSSEPTTIVHGHVVGKVPTIDQMLFSAASLGFGLLVSVWLFYRVTGGIFNPAVSTGLLLIGAIGPVRWALYCIAQLLGSIVASALLLALLPGPLVVSTTLATGVNAAQGVFIEAFLTAALVLAVLMLAAEKHRSTPFAPIGIGLTLFVGQLWGGLYTGAAMNTARAFGPAVVTGFDEEHWVYWVGPFVGSLMATAFYSVLKHIRYWQLNPEQDVSDPKKSPAGPVSNIMPNGHLGGYEDKGHKATANHGSA